MSYYNQTVADKLYEFRNSFGKNVDNKNYSYEDLILHVKLIAEEYAEVMQAFDELIAARDANDAGQSVDVSSYEKALLKELIDLEYVCVDTSVDFGWLHDAAFNRVHESNMTKLGADGKPVYREDGKILKGENYKPANMEGCV